MPQQLIRADIRVAHQFQRSRAKLPGIMRRDGGCHAHRNPRRAIGEQMRKGRRQHDGFAFFAIISRAEIYRVFLNPLQQGLRHFRQPRFGVTHCSSVIAINIAEIALAFDQRVARREILREPHHRLINRAITMGVIFTHHIADDTRAFLEPRFGIKPQLPHRPKQAAMHGLQPIPHIRQRPRGNRGKRIGQIAFRQRIREPRFTLRPVGRQCFDIIGHGRIVSLFSESFSHRLDVVQSLAATLASRLRKAFFRYSFIHDEPRHRPRNAGLCPTARTLGLGDLG